MFIVAANRTALRLAGAALLGRRIYSALAAGELWRRYHALPGQPSVYTLTPCTIHTILTILTILTIHIMYYQVSPVLPLGMELVPSTGEMMHCIPLCTVYHSTVYHCTL
jgi:hypothetical protein